MIDYPMNPEMKSSYEILSESVKLLPSKALVMAGWENIWMLKRTVEGPVVTCPKHLLLESDVS